MCGYFAAFSRHHARWDETRINQATTPLQRRGPDSSGRFQDDNSYLVHHRLQVIDNNPLSDQPFCLNDDLVLVFTGEIYNHQSLRKSHLAHLSNRFKTESDTETLAYLYQEHKEGAFRYLEGEFSGVLYDRNDQKVIFFRDPVGVKPLYYSADRNNLFISDLLNPVRSMQESESINPNALGEHIALRYCLGNHTIIKNIYRLAPQSYAVFKLNEEVLQVTNYQQDASSWQNIEEHLLHLFSQRASYNNSALFLSSGVDSSLLASFTKDSNFSGFTMSMDDGTSSSEAIAASHYSEQLNLAHHEVRARFETIAQTKAAVQKSLIALEEPIGDPIAILQSELFEKASQITKVALSGEAADEVFMGYAHHRAALLYDQAPAWIFKITPTSLLEWLLTKLNPYPARIHAEDILRLNRALFGGFSPLVEELTMVIKIKDVKKICPEAETETLSEYFSSIRCMKTLQEQEWCNWLPNYNLARIDKLSLYHGLEVRLPYADQRLFLRAKEQYPPSALKLQKSALHKLARQRIPKKYWPTPKRPFTVLKNSRYGEALKEFCWQELKKENTQRFFDTYHLTRVLQNENSIFHWKALYNLASLKLWLEINH